MDYPIQVIRACVRRYKPARSTVAQLNNGANPMETTTTERERYFNVAALTTDGRTIQSQVWTNDSEQAVAALRKWTSQREEEWHGQILRGTVYDSATKQLREFVRLAHGSIEERSEKAYKTLVHDNEEMREALQDISEAVASRVYWRQKLSVIRDVLKELKGWVQV